MSTAALVTHVVRRSRQQWPSSYFSRLPLMRSSSVLQLPSSLVAVIDTATRASSRRRRRQCLLQHVDRSRWLSASKSPTQQQRSLSINSTETVVVTAPNTTTTANNQEASAAPSLLSSYSELAKARLSALVVSTTAAGFVAAGAAPILSTPFASCLLGTALCSSSAAAWNQILEVDRDKLMKRTATRPLVTGALSLLSAQVAGTVWGVAGTSLLALGTDPVTTALGAGNMVLYAGLYTYLKPRSVSNTWVGAAVGAIPPVMGWTAATAAGGSTAAAELLSLDGSGGTATAALLAATLYLWQMPHFFALSFMHRVDYKRGGFQMVPCLESDGQRTAQLVVRYAWYLSAVPVVATLTNVTSSMFALEGVVLNGYALVVAHRFERDRTNANARKVFLTSLWYLPCLLMLFLLHSKVWDQETNEHNKENDDVIIRFLSDQIYAIRQRGRELCWHEKRTTPGACPVTMGKQATQKTLQAVESSSVAAAAAAASEQVIVIPQHPAEAATTASSDT